MKSVFEGDVARFTVRDDVRDASVTFHPAAKGMVAVGSFDIGGSFLGEGRLQIIGSVDRLHITGNVTGTAGAANSGSIFIGADLGTLDLGARCSARPAIFSRAR